MQVNNSSYKHTVFLISSVTLVNARKDHIPDGNGSGSAIVSHLEILTLTHQLYSEC